MCVTVDDKPIAENKCTNQKPIDSEICDMGSCAKTWFYTRWSDEVRVIQLYFNGKKHLKDLALLKYEGVTFKEWRYLFHYLWFLAITKIAAKSCNLAAYLVHVVSILAERKRLIVGTSSKIQRTTYITSSSPSIFLPSYNCNHHFKLDPYYTEFLKQISNRNQCFSNIVVVSILPMHSENFFKKITGVGNLKRHLFFIPFLLVKGI